MKLPSNPLYYDSVSGSPYSPHPNPSTYALNNQRINSGTAAGGTAHTSTPSNSNNAHPCSSPSFTDRRQELPPSPPAENLHGTYTTELTPTVVQINQEFGGNDRYLYPPIRPPIEEDSPRKTGRPNIAEATNAALAKWYGALEHQSQQQRIAPAHPGPHQFLNNAPPAALHLPELERFVGLGSSGAALDPQSFADPECQVHSLDINMVAPNDLTQKYRLLPKRGVSRRLNAQPHRGAKWCKLF